MIPHSTDPPNHLFDLMEYFEEIAEVCQENHGGNGDEITGDFI